MPRLAQVDGGRDPVLFGSASMASMVAAERASRIGVVRKDIAQQSRLHAQSSEKARSATLLPRGSGLKAITRAEERLAKTIDGFEADAQAADRSRRRGGGPHFANPKSSSSEQIMDEEPGSRIRWENASQHAAARRAGMSASRLGWGEHARIILFGGRTASGGLGSLAVFDPQSLRWVTEKTPVLPFDGPCPDAAEPRLGHTSSAIGRHQLLIFGGVDGYGRLLDVSQRCRILQVTGSCFAAHIPALLPYAHTPSPLNA